MFNHVVLGQYVAQNSLLHKADPRSKIISIFMLCIVLFYVEQLISYTAFSLFLAVSIILAKIPLDIVWRTVKPILWFILLTFVFNIFLTPGETLWSYGPLIITYEGIEKGLAYSWRLFLLFLYSGLLTWTTSPLDIAGGLGNLLRPLRKIKFPVGELVMMLTLALRFLPTLLEETEKIIKAQTARGMDFTEGTIIERAKNILPLLVPLFVSIFQRADDLANAMDARCYQGDVERTRMQELAFTMRDYLIILVVICFCISVIFNG